MLYICYVLTVPPEPRQPAPPPTLPAAEPALPIPPRQSTGNVVRPQASPSRAPVPPPPRVAPTPRVSYVLLM